MLGFVQSWFGSTSSPIGVDFGSDCLRLAQVEEAEGEHRLVAAASADVPTHVRNDPAARFQFFGESIRELLGQGNFRGRRVALSLPASLMHIQHLRMPKMDDEALKKALPWEARGKLPFDPSQAVLRHVVAGEIYHDQEPKYEIVLMAARKDWVELLLAAAAKARLDIAGMNVEPKALIDCFSHVYRRRADREAPTLFVDVGCTASRAIIARDGKIRFARVIPIGGEHFSRAVASSMRIPLEEARVLRIKLCKVQPSEPASEKNETQPPRKQADPLTGTGFSLLNAAVTAAEHREAKANEPAAATMTAVAPRIEVEPAVSADDVSLQTREKVEEACREPLAKLVEELALCRRYYETTFPTQPVERLIFVGGEAHQRLLCQQIAREMGVAAQVGDPLARMGKFTEPGIENVIDRRVPQPTWTVALGLSMGPAGADPAETSK